MNKIISSYPRPSRPTKRQLNLKYINLGLFVLLLGLGTFYLVTVSDLTVKGFALKELKTRASELASEKLAAEETVNNLQSYYSLSARTAKLDMVNVGEIEYLAVPSVTVARN